LPISGGDRRERIRESGRPYHFIRMRHSLQNERKADMRAVLTSLAMVTIAFLLGAAEFVEDGGARNTADTPAALDFTMKSIDGKDINLAEKYRGKVVLMVNVASRCGYTKQYAGLQKLHEQYGEKGLVVLGFPANNFGGQEPGTNEEILEFCTSEFKVAFPMFAKVSVKGDDICPLYKLLTDPSKTQASEGDIKWNFEKFLLDRSGKVIRHYRSKATPEEIAGEIESLLDA